MQRMKLTQILGLLTVLGAFALPVEARTVPASAGRAFVGANENIFNAPNGSIYKTPQDGSLYSWVVPITFDFSGARTIRVRGKCPTNGNLSCQAVALKTDGTLASSSSSLTFPQNNTFTFIDSTLSSVPSGATGSVGCSFSGPTCTLLNIDYLP